jgi:hypothetical protein
MAETKARDRWAHTSCVLAMIANAHRDPKKTRAYRPSDFSPFEKKRKHGIPITPGNIGLLKEVFVDGGSR